MNRSAEIRPSAFTFAMRALGRNDPPARFDLRGERFDRTQIVKHDFWAATAFYESAGGAKVVAKINRLQPFCGLNFEVVGRWLCRREARFYAALADVDNVPALLGRIGSTGFIHAYVEGRPLSRGDHVSSEFFPQLKQLLTTIHQRQMAYVDANKPQNILLGEDGRPYLIDFQISYDLREVGDWFLTRALLRIFQTADLYHVLKHTKKFRGDLMSADDLARLDRQSRAIRIHRWVTRPYFLIRRPAMRRLRDHGKLLPEGSK